MAAFYNDGMIAHLRGRLLSKTPASVIVECGGVGYEAAISVATYTALPETPNEVALYIYTHVREDQIALFGFAERKEKVLFEKLLSISGIGPKLAITVLSGIAADRLVAAIRAGDHASLTKIPGIGKKTAERVVLELKDKLDELAAGTATPTASAGYTTGPATEDVLSALINLGYPRAAAERAMEAAIAKEQAVAGEFEALFRASMAAMR